MVGQKSSLFWAKTPERFRRSNIRDEDAGLWLSLSQHMRDSADVGICLFEAWLPNSVQDRLVDLAGGWEEAGALVGWLAGTHDIGKAELHFASQLQFDPIYGYLSDRILDAFELQDSHLKPERKLPHSVNSDLILSNWITEHFPDAPESAAPTLSSVAGCHHGKPSGITWNMRKPDSPAQYWLSRHGGEWTSSWGELIEDITERTRARPVLETVLSQGGIGVEDQVLLSGLVTMADWLASNQEIFELSLTGRHVTDESRAETALDRLRLTRTWEPQLEGDPPFRQRFGWPADAKLRPVQEAVLQAVSECSGPSLIVIEEEMGQGKTEAALLAAEVIAAREGLGGVVFALPTMATTDAMFGRFQNWVAAVTEEDEELHSLFLGHSRAILNPKYEDLIRKTKSVFGADESEESVIAHQWFTGKKGLLAEFSVTTIDQVLMSALATRHVTMRHLGLAGKVVIIDEVHSFDVYTSSYLQRMLTWLGAQGASVIMLSATLAESGRQMLSKAFAEGVKKRDGGGGGSDLLARYLASRGVGGQAGLSNNQQENSRVPYPRITSVDRSGTKQSPIQPRVEHRKVHFEFIDDTTEVLSTVCDELSRDGGIIGIICNTVRRAQDVYQYLLEQNYPSVELLHSQFTALDRAQREDALVARLGPKVNRGTGRPKSHIVVGTQILEQSLDIDFDILITDLAPMDSLLQRMGRLHRHKRPSTDRPQIFQEPRVLLRGLDLIEAVPHFDSGSSAIYGDRVLLATVAKLNTMKNQQLCLTHDLENLVEDTYADELTIPTEWEVKYQLAKEKEAQRIEQSSERAKQFQLLKPIDSRGDMGKALGAMLKTDVSLSDAAAAANVRDIEPGLEVLLIVQRGEYLEPLPWLLPDGFRGVRLSESEVPPQVLSEVIAASVLRLPRWLIPPGKAIDDAIRVLEKFGIQSWQSDYRLKGQLVLRLDENLQGELIGKRFQYDSKIGFTEVKFPQGT